MFQPTAKQVQAIELYKGPATNILFYGGTRSGKTATHVETIKYKCLKYPGSRHLAARLRFAHARTSLFHETFIPALKELPDNLYSINKTDCMIQFANGSEIWIGGFDDADRIEKILGHEYATVYFNECSQIGYNTVLTGLTRLAQNIPGCKNKALYDENPPSPLHWSYKLFILKQDPETGKSLTRPELYSSILINPADNAKYLPPNYIQDFLEILPDRQKRRFLYGEFVKMAGVIYDEFEESMIIPVSAVPPIEFYTVGLDFGINSVAVLIGFAGENAYVLDEICLYNLTASELNRTMREKWNNKQYVAYCDPSGGERLQEINFSRPANNSVEPGIDCLRKLQHSNNFWVVDTCCNVINGLSTYCRDDKERILKENDHECDAVRYGIFSEKSRVRWGLA